MELNKKKYKKEEVEVLLSSCKIQYESELKSHCEKEAELVEQNRKLFVELSAYREKDEMISASLISAQSQAKEILDDANRKCELELEHLKDFSRRWKGYFEYISEKYPHYEALKEAQDVYKKMSSILSTKRGKGAINGVEKVLAEKSNIITNRLFDPKEKINDYIAATSDNGFNLDEVLNPGELKLEDLCKELGLIDEN